MKLWKYNVLVAPVVILIRIPLLVPLWLLIRIGEYSEYAWQWIDASVPGFKRR